VPTVTSCHTLMPGQTTPLGSGVSFARLAQTRKKEKSGRLDRQHSMAVAQVHMGRTQADFSEHCN